MSDDPTTPADQWSHFPHAGSIFQSVLATRTRRSPCRWPLNSTFPVRFWSISIFNSKCVPEMGKCAGSFRANVVQCANLNLVVGLLNVTIYRICVILDDSIILVLFFYLNQYWLEIWKLMKIVSDLNTFFLLFQISIKYKILVLSSIKTDQFQSVYFFYFNNLATIFRTEILIFFMKNRQ